MCAVTVGFNRSPRASKPAQEINFVHVDELGMGEEE